MLEQILLALEKLSSFVVLFRLLAEGVGNTIRAALWQATLPNIGRNVEYSGETKMPDEADEALKWLAELERKNNMPEKNDNDFIKKILEYEKKAGHEIRVEVNAGPHIARWAGADNWSIIEGSTSNEAAYIDFGHVPDFKYVKAEPMTYENSHDLSQYKCDHCGRWMVQLWREGRKSYDPPPRVLCIWCVGDVEGQNYRGTLEDTEINIDTQFGGWVPAIPYNNQGEYLVMPPRVSDLKRYGVEWWLGLKR